MRVLIQSRPDCRVAPGGDTIQMDRTAEFLGKAGHAVRISCDPSPDLAAIDVVHLFNLTRPAETVTQARNAEGQRKPFVLSPVYWNLEAAVPWSAHGFVEGWRLRLAFARARLLKRPRRSGAPAPLELQREIVRAARLIFPNSEAEKRHLLDKFPELLPERLHVVYNGVEPVALPTNRRPRVFLCAGAIGPRKNQLNLVRAFRRLPHEQLIILGQTAPHCQNYRRAVELAAGSNVEFHEGVPHERMADYWAITKVLVQPSYIETPGLSALEAAGSGIPVVVSRVPPVEEYFGQVAHYCDPWSPRSIARACAQASSDGPRGGGEDLLRRFAWETVLAPLTDAYAALETAR